MLRLIGLLVAVVLVITAIWGVHQIAEAYINLFSLVGSSRPVHIQK